MVNNLNVKNVLESRFNIINEQTRKRKRNNLITKIGLVGVVGCSVAKYQYREDTSGDNKVLYVNGGEYALK